MNHRRQSTTGKAMLEVFVVCVDEESGYHMAYDLAGHRGWGDTAQMAVVDLLEKADVLKVHHIDKDK